MNVDPVFLLAYVDGKLSPEEMEQVNLEMGRSADVADYVADLMASRLPYEDAFNAQKIPPLPAALIEQVGKMAKTVQAGHADADEQHIASRAVPHSAVRAGSRMTPAWLVTAFAAGIACAVIGMSLFVASGGEASHASQSAQKGGTWMEAAAGYQQLYSRATVDHVIVDTNASMQTLAEIRHDDKLDIRVPDLTADGLEFKRIQRLNFHGRALVQIVYLPKQGDPIALCVMNEAPKADNAVSTREVSGMNVTSWRKSALGYALIGNAQGIDLADLAKRIANNQVESLFAPAA